MKIAVFGMGYVGTVSAACLADAGHDVIGVDVNDAKVEAINAGRAPIIEPGLDELVAATRETGRLRATTDVENAVAGSEMSWICVGTPSSSAGRLDTSALERVVETIGGVLRPSADAHAVVIRSTALPGTTETLLQPILERSAQREVSERLEIFYHPEFMREGTGVEDFRSPSRVVVGTLDGKGAGPLGRLYGDFGHDCSVVPIRIAEMIKYADNAWHAVKISFANEIGRYAKRLGIDGRELMELFCEDTHLNISTRYLRPGFAFGGSCLPKDLRALVHRARELDVEVPLLGAVLPSNDRHLAHARKLVTDAGNRRVGLLGLSFKPGTDDLRESPFVGLAEFLVGKGYEVAIYDPLVNLSALTGSNREYLDVHLPHIRRLLVGSPEELLASADTLVLGHADLLPPERLSRLPGDMVVVDLTPFATGRPAAARYDGICW